MIDRMCQRYSCLPSQLLAEDIYMVQMLNILSAAGELDAEQGGNKSMEGAGDIEASLANTSF
jgi:hypothetical protein